MQVAVRVGAAVVFLILGKKIAAIGPPFPVESPPHTHPHNRKTGHSPSLRTEYALGANFPRGYHFKPLFREFPAVLRPGTPNPTNRSKLTSAATNRGISGSKSRWEASKAGFGHLKNNYKWPACCNCSSFLILDKKIAEIGPLYGPKTRRKWPDALNP